MQCKALDRRRLRCHCRTRKQSGSKRDRFSASVANVNGFRPRANEKETPAHDRPSDTEGKTAFPQPYCKSLLCFHLATFGHLVLALRAMFDVSALPQIKQDCDFQQTGMRALPNFACDGLFDHSIQRGTPSISRSWRASCKDATYLI